MHKRFLTLLALGVGVILIGAGCGAKNPSDFPGKGNGLDKNQGARGNGQLENGFRGINFTTGTVSNLIVGAKVTAMGASNSDGSVSATRIMIGDMPMMNFSSSTRPSTTPANISDNQDLQRQGGRDSEQGRNWGGGQRTGAVRPSRAVGQNSARGEIISTSTSSFVVKLADGGSKMVFYSPSTQIMIFQSPTSTPMKQ